MENLPKITNSQLLKKWNLYDKSMKKRKITMGTPQPDLPPKPHHSQSQSISIKEIPVDPSIPQDGQTTNQAYQDSSIQNISRNLALRSKERARKNKKAMSKSTFKNYRRLEEQKKLQVENIRLLKRLQNSIPTYNYDDYENENKKKKRLLNRICMFPYQFDRQSHKRTQSKLNIRRNLSIRKSNKKNKRHLSHTNSEFKTMNQSQEVASTVRMGLEEENKMREENYEQDVQYEQEALNGVNESADVLIEGHENPQSVNNTLPAEPNKRYRTKKSKDKRAVFLKSVYKRKMFYREYLLTNVFHEEFDRLKRDRVKLEKFVKISNKECFLTVCSGQTKYYFMAICCKTKKSHLIAVFRKKVKKLLQIYNNSLVKVSKLLRIKNDRMFIKDLDFLLKDQVNVRDSLPDHFRLNRSHSRGSGRNSPDFAAHDDNMPENERIMSQEDLNKNETVTVQDIYKLPKSSPYLSFTLGDFKQAPKRKPKTRQRAFRNTSHSRFMSQKMNKYMNQTAIYLS